MKTLKNNKFNHPLYITWRGIKSRCCCKTFRDYKRYGGRGITMCEEWLNDFETFAKDMGKRPNGKSIEEFHSRWLCENYYKLPLRVKLKDLKDLKDLKYERKI